MNNKKWFRTAKFATYIVVMVLLYILQTTPGFLTVFGVKPNFVIPAAVCVAMHEGEFTGAFYGVLAGVLCDWGGFALAGFNAMILLAACTAVGLLVIYLLRPGVINFVLLLSAVMLARGLLDFLLNYVMWGYDHVWMVFVYDVLPGVIYTVAVSPLVYYLYTAVHAWFEGRMEA